MSTVLNRQQVSTDTADREQVFDAFRRWGYLQADLDPLRKELSPVMIPELDISGPVADEARQHYSGTIGVEFMHITDPERRRWIIDQIEAAPSPVDREFILKRLVQADVFEQVLQSRYLGTKRFSLEGVTAIIPLLDAILQCAIEHNAVQAVIGMSHRGRLNVIAHVVGRNPADVFAGFEDVDPRSVLGGGDVKYHQGATGVYTGRDGRTVKAHMVSNPSHLEAVDPVVLGRTRAKQVRLGGEDDPRILPMIMHGDAAFAGQGISAETLNLSQLEGFTVGGTLHVIANNLIGFTATPAETYSSRFSSDLAKRLPIPIFHVNAEDPEAVVRVGRIALEYRYKFQSDVVIDVIGYRRHGHSEVEDPSITQPVLYRKIKDHPALSKLYADRIGAEEESFVTEAKSRLESAQQSAKELEKRPLLYELPPYWSAYVGGCHKREYEVTTGVSAEELEKVTRSIISYPSDFHIHPKMKKLLQQRQEMGAGKRPVDYGMAEALAFATLLETGTPVRLTGQDSRRGTFNQRHAVLLDIEDEHTYVPLEHVSPDQGRFEVYNTELSEAAVMGFEYGYSRDYPEALVLWEAQFGDFANGGQIIIDQFVSSGEDKWGLLCGLVLLLPHGYEGQGPEHSSARIERYLQLAAKDSMQITQPSTAAQYFHLLRRQALRKWRKPLVVFTPKSMLRHPDAMSKLEEFSRPNFLNVIPDNSVQDAQRLLVCTGKIVHELHTERTRRKDTTTAIISLEQLYPFPERELEAALQQHPNAQDIVWVQEEPANMGALWYVLPRLRRIAKPRPVRSVKRSPSASPATGSAKAHEMEQKTLLNLAFT